MRGAKLKKRLTRDFGQTPDPFYYHGDMEYIQAYYEYRRKHGLDDFLIDDITWNDLDMDRVFRRINMRSSTSGEQYLYYMLRSPATTEEGYRNRKKVIDYMCCHEDVRLKLQVLFARLGCTRRADISKAFAPTAHKPYLLILYLVLALLIPAAAVLSTFHLYVGTTMLLIGILLNSMVHELAKRRVRSDFEAVNYTVSMVFTLQKIRKLHVAELDKELKPAYVCLDNLRSILHTGGISTVSDNGMAGDILVSVFLLDLITYEFLKTKLWRSKEDIFGVHEHLGRLDAAISIASYRKSTNCLTEPELDFTSQPPCSIEAAEAVHPLLHAAVANDLIARRNVLLTGSNASGKSTFLKAMALCALMAQSICTCSARTYKATAFRIYSSMALRDDLLAGESYYIVETKSLKRILDATSAGVPLLCIIDEVLRGTNTIERIAASSEILQELSAPNTICLAATHDLELCDMLSRQYDLYHFQEFISEHDMLFDYKLHPGKATSRNAIELLRLVGFPERLVDAAHKKADQFLAKGAWTAE